LINRFRHYYCRLRKNIDLTFEQISEDRLVACGDDFSVGEDCGLSVEEIDKYSTELGLKLTVADAHVDFNLEFAGVNTIFFERIAVPKVDVKRISYSIYVIKKGMTPAERISKLDNLIRIVCISDYKVALELIRLRDLLVRMFSHNADVQMITGGLVTFTDAVRAHMIHLEPDFIITH